MSSSQLSTTLAGVPSFSRGGRAFLCCGTDSEFGGARRRGQGQEVKTTLKLASFVGIVAPILSPSF